jgi:hypothetical protein
MFADHVDHRRAASTPSELARRVFQVKYNLHLVPGARQWLEELCETFAIEDEKDIVDTFEHLVAGVQGSGSGLGELLPLVEVPRKVS